MPQRRALASINIRVSSQLSCIFGNGLGTGISAAIYGWRSVTKMPVNQWLFRVTVKACLARKRYEGAGGHGQ
jgi:hypothetical protein